MQAMIIILNLDSKFATVSLTNSFCSGLSVNAMTMKERKKASIDKKIFRPVLSLSWIE